MAVDFSSVFQKHCCTLGDYAIDYITNHRQDAPTVILVHGIGASGRYFSLLANELARSYNVVVVDLPGFGSTPKPRTALDIAEFANILAEFITVQHIIKPILLGHSMGCQIVAQIAVVHPKRISKMILLAPTINRNERSAPLQLMRLVQDTTREPYAVNKILLIDYIKFGFLRYLQTQKYMIADRIEEKVSTCAQPILVLRGKRDKIVPHTWAQYLTTRSLNAKLAEIDGAAHVIQYTAAKKVGMLCVDFIELS